MANGRTAAVAENRNQLVRQRELQIVAIAAAAEIRERKHRDRRLLAGGRHRRRPQPPDGDRGDDHSQRCCCDPDGPSARFGDGCGAGAVFEPLQIGSDIGRRLIAQLPILLQRLRNDGADVGTDGRRLTIQDRIENRRRRRARKRPATGGELVNHRAE